MVDEETQTESPKTDQIQEALELQNEAVDLRLSLEKLKKENVVSPEIEPTPERESLNITREQIDMAIAFNAQDESFASDDMNFDEEMKRYKERQEKRILAERKFEENRKIEIDIVQNEYESGIAQKKAAEQKALQDIQKQ